MREPISRTQIINAARNRARRIDAVLEILEHCRETNRTLQATAERIVNYLERTANVSR